jgi:DNA-binding transcriptional ArsR family regulator
MLNQSSGLDRLFQALADPTRRDMVERLSRGPASVSELARPLPISLPAVLQHLQVLESSGLVRSEKVGRVRTCQIEPAALRLVEQWIADRRSRWERRFDRLGAVLADQADADQALAEQSLAERAVPGLASNEQPPSEPSAPPDQGSSTA